MILVLLMTVVILWVSSILGLGLRSEGEKIKGEIIEINQKIELDNLQVLIEREIFCGDKRVNEGEFQNIFEYFCGKENCWIKENGISETNYRRVKVIQNGIEKNGDIYMIKGIENIFEIELVKIFDLLDKEAELKILLEYRYEKDQMDFTFPMEQKIKEMKIRYR